MNGKPQVLKTLIQEINFTRDIASTNGTPCIYDSNHSGIHTNVFNNIYHTQNTWIWVYFATDAWHLYVARFSAGLTLGASFICIPLFVAEISSERYIYLYYILISHKSGVYTIDVFFLIGFNNSIRGKLSSLMILFFNLGILLGYIAGKYLAFATVPKVMVLVPILFMLTFVGLPNTPQFLLQQSKVYVS